jgi:hypothetical protein
MVAAIVAATEKSLPELGWKAANRIANARTGVATQVSAVE